MHCVHEFVKQLSVVNVFLLTRWADDIAHRNGELIQRFLSRREKSEQN